MNIINLMDPCASPPTWPKIQALTYSSVDTAQMNNFVWYQKSLPPLYNIVISLSAKLFFVFLPFSKIYICVMAVNFTLNRLGYKEIRWN